MKRKILLTTLALQASLSAGYVSQRKFHSTDSPSALPLSNVATWTYTDNAPGTFGLRDYMDVLVQQAPRVQSEEPAWKIFCDLDGVLVDFEAGINRVFPNEPGIHHVDDHRRKDMWRRLEASGRFFELLPWTECGRDLWKAIQPLQPDILTGVPVHSSSRIEKFNWCKRELAIPLSHVDKAGHLYQHYHINNIDRSRPVSARKPETKVITCWSFNKHHESGPRRVLIDDRIALKEAWEAKGGVFIHHNGDLQRTLTQLVNHGILSKYDLKKEGLF